MGEHLNFQEAEKLARDLMPRNAGQSVLVTSADLRKLCHAILSGDIKREIENAAFRRALSRITNGTCDSLSEAEDRIRALVVHASDCAMNNAPALPAGPCDCGALIQPPAQQKENGE